MAEINANGYQSIRDYMETNWKYIELRDDTSTAIVRLSPTDARVTWTHIAGAQTLKLQIIVTGSDADIPVPQIFASSAIYDVATLGSPYSVETFTAFTISADEDQLTIIHNIQVPQVV